MARIAVVKKTQEEKREEVRRNILEAAMELFYNKGYDATTTRDIVYKAGILNGSLYNRFKSKEEILLSLVTEAISDFLREAGKVFKDEKDPVVAFVMPGALEFFISSHSPKAADIIYAAHKSWAAVSTYADNYIEWIGSLLSDTGMPALEDESFRIKVTAIVGAVGNVCAMYANGLKKDYKAPLTYLIKIISTIVDLPVFDLKGVVQKISGVIENTDITILGHDLREFEDYVPPS